MEKSINAERRVFPYDSKQVGFRVQPTVPSPKTTLKKGQPTKESTGNLTCFSSDATSFSGRP